MENLMVILLQNFMLIISLVCNFFSFYAIYLLRKEFEQFKKK